MDQNQSNEPRHKTSFSKKKKADFENEEPPRRASALRVANKKTLDII